MNNETVESLRQALSFSPDNVPLKLHLAETLASLNRLSEAEQEYHELMQMTQEPKVSLGLANVFYRKNEYSKCNVLLEEYLEHDKHNFEALLLHTRALLREHSIQQAIATYQKVIAIDPSFSDEELDKELRVSNTVQTVNEVDDNPYFIQHPGISFSDVGGMEHIKKEIELKIIQPLLHPEIYKAYGKKTGGGILLYGPPGCGKTYIAKATAGQVNARFISVGLNDILDMWIGNSEKNLNDIFETARQNTPCVLFFDEIDALGASRSDMKQSAGRHLINQFLQELDGVENNNDGVLILGATNTPWHLDQAFRRPGRFDRIIFIPPPDEAARDAIFKLKLQSKPAGDINYKSLAQKTAGYSGADIDAAIDIAIEEKLEQAIKQGAPQPLDTKDILNAVKKHKATTSDWFSTAKNFALYANESGLYDDILSYMKIKK